MTTPDRFVAGAIDLGEVKARAEARQKAHTQGPATGGIAASLNVTMENLENEVLRRSTQVPVVVLVGTSRSPDSEQLRADFTELADASNLSFIFGYIDADHHADVAQVFGVTGLPTVIAVAAGRPLADFQGGQPKEALSQWVSSVVQAVDGKLEGLPQGTEAAADNEDATQEEPGDPRFEAATEALNNGDFDGAVGIYDDILAVEPNNAEAKQARDTALLLGRLSTAAPGADAIAAADAEPTDVEKAFAAADAEIVAGDPTAAFDRLIALIRVTSGKERDSVKDRLLQAFGMFEPSDSRVIAARGALASALF